MLHGWNGLTSAPWNRCSVYAARDRCIRAMGQMPWVHKGTPRCWRAVMTRSHDERTAPPAEHQWHGGYTFLAGRPVSARRPPSVAPNAGARPRDKTRDPLLHGWNGHASAPWQQTQRGRPTAALRGGTPARQDEGPFHIRQAKEVHPPAPRPPRDRCPSTRPPEIDAQSGPRRRPRHPEQEPGAPAAAASSTPLAARARPARRGAPTPPIRACGASSRPEPRLSPVLPCCPHVEHQRRGGVAWAA